MRAGIIGAGRVGCSLAIALLKKGVQITGVYSRDMVSTRTILEGHESHESHESYESHAYTIFEDIYQLVESCDTVFITVPDTSIYDVAQQIAQNCRRGDLEGKVFLHCSGALTSDELCSIRTKGGFTGSLHPIQTFPDRMGSWESMYHIYFGFEGSREAEATAEKVVSLLDGRMVRVHTEGKRLYHAAACVLSNYVVTLSHLAGRLLESAGMDGDIGLKAFMVLLRSTVENIERLGSMEALTGPISRGDTGTVSAHLEAMETSLAGEAILYKNLGWMTVAIALKKGTIDQERAQKLMQLLGHIDN